jgi:Pyridoxamine 5'-phosphate oxidase
MGPVTTSWSDFERAEPAFAEAVRTRFAAYRHHVLATLRADGSPRVSGTEADFRLGDLWLGSMPNARKVRDLLRDPRFALHANPGPGTDMDGGDVRLAGRAIQVTDPQVLARFVAEAQPPQPFDLFRVDLAEAVRVFVEADEMVVQSWRPGAGRVRVQRRGNDDGPVREA